MLNAPDKQISLTDPDARSMKTRGTGIVGYNVQTAVDTEHHMIVAHEVTNSGSDRRQLANMAKQAKSVIATEQLTAVADRGYYRGEDILDCDKANITSYLPKPQTSGNQAKGQFGRDAFRYIAEDNEYECPAGLRLVQLRKSPWIEFFSPLVACISDYGNPSPENDQDDYSADHQVRQSRMKNVHQDASQDHT